MRICRAALPPCCSAPPSSSSKPLPPQAAEASSVPAVSTATATPRNRVRLMSYSCVCEGVSVGFRGQAVLRITSDGTRSTGACAPAWSPSRRWVSSSMQRAAASGSGWLTLVSPTACATGVSSNPATAAPWSPTARSAPRASESLAQTSAVGGASRASSSRRARLALVDPVLGTGGRGREPIPARDQLAGQPARRSSPTPEPGRPADERDPAVAGLDQPAGGLAGAGGAVDVDPRPVVSARPTAGRTSRTARRVRPATAAGGRRGRCREHEGVEVVRARAGPRTWRSRRSSLVRRVEHHAVAGDGGGLGESVQEAVEDPAVDAVAGRLDPHGDQPATDRCASAGRPGWRGSRAPRWPPRPGDGSPRGRCAGR